MHFVNHENTGLLAPLVDGTRLRLVGNVIRPKARVLEIGCGNGLLLRHLPRVSYTGVELDSKTVEWLKGRYPEHKFLCWSAGEPLPAGEFDVIVMAAFIEHIEPGLQGPLLLEVKRRLAPDGILVLTTPTPVGGRVHKAMAAFGLVSKEAAEEHKGFLSGRQLRELLVRAGFVVSRHGHYFCGMAHFVTAKVRVD